MKLLDIVERNVFDTHPLLLSGGFSHASFDGFTGRQDVEHRLARAIKGLSRCAVVAPSGWGKTNLAAHGLLHTDSVLPITVAVAHEDPNILLDVGRFGRHLLDAIVRAGEESEVLTERAAKRHLGEAGGEMINSGGTSTTRHAGGSLGWSAISGELRREVVERSADLAIRASVARTKEHLTGVLEDLRNASFLPTLYFDDTDRLLGAGGTADASSLVQQFFGPLFRWLSELPCGVLCSAQPEYLQLPVCHEAIQRGLIQETINVPALTSAEQIRRVLAVHVGAHELSEDEWNSALDDAAVDDLFALYEGGTAGGLRRPVRLIELATRIAVERASERISVSLIRAALDELM